MKKRSLFAAVAMLIVSAIVLTSATYAWFVAGSAEVSVDAINADVSSSDGSLAIRATINNNTEDSNQVSGYAAHGPWVAGLTSADYRVKTSANDTTNVIPTSLTPVDVDFTNGVEDVYINTLSYDGSTFTSFGQATANDGYQHYGFDVKLTVDSTETGKTVTMTPEFDRQESFVYALVKVGSSTDTQYYLYGVKGTAQSYDSYIPITSMTDDVRDEGSNRHIIDASDAPAANFTLKNSALGAVKQEAITLFNAQTATVNAQTQVKTTEFTVPVEVYVFAEGQDTNCIPRTISADDIAISFDFEVQ